MSIICFASLKGGVGKTSLSVNVAHAFACRDCRTLVIDLDPTCHASRFFVDWLDTSSPSPSPSPLAHLFLQSELPEGEALLESYTDDPVPLLVVSRDSFDILPAGGELRHFLWGQGARTFRALFPQLLDELRVHYDHIIIDTPPDFNVLTRNAIAHSDLVVVPVDSSAMSVNCLEEIVESSSHIKRPRWCIVRSLVTKAASRIQQLTSERLSENLSLESSEAELLEKAFVDDRDASAEDFLQLLESGSEGSNSEEDNENEASERTSPTDSPIYLLNSVVYRSEQQNRLSHLRKTAFDNRETNKLAEQYLSVARELESLIERTWTLQEKYA